MALAELIVDFYDQLKSRTQGYASLDYSFGGYQEADLVKLDILVNGYPVEALSLVLHHDKAYQQGRILVERLGKLIPKQLLEVTVQATIVSPTKCGGIVKELPKEMLSKLFWILYISE